MADLELVIKVDERDVDLVRKNFKSMGYSFIPLHIQTEFVSAILNGTPLPKGHGNIGDLDKLIRAMKERNDDNGGEPLNAVDRGYDLAFQHMIEESKECVIIEADKEQEDGKV